MDRDRTAVIIDIAAILIEHDGQDYAEARYCPFCGAEIHKWGHDTNCPRPKNFMWFPVKVR